jgi:hypothetical protein
MNRRYPVTPPTAAEREVLRALVEQTAAVAALPVQAEKAELWRRLNDRRSVRPMIWITEIPWHEFSEDSDELRLRCTTPWLRPVERELRKTLYQWRHLPGDMIVSDYLPCPIAFHSTGLGIERQGDHLDITRGGIISQHFEPQITRLEDVAKIKDPVVTVDRADTAARLELMRATFGDLMPVREEGIKLNWYSAWDQLVVLYGVQEALTDLIEQPEVIHATVRRLVEAHLVELDQYEAEGLLMYNAGNNRVGAGAYGHCSDLPAAGSETGERVGPGRMWGCSNAQIFAEVSPAMHWEFALLHDLPWLERWGLNYYGCCEPLDTKMEVLRRIPRLRKVSMNYRIHLDRAAAAVGDEFVFSYKPNPACFATDTWNPALAAQELSAVLAATRGGHVELVLKDISTVAGKPERLWDWAALASALVEAEA